MRYLFVRTRLSRQLPICLIYAYAHFDTSVFRLCLLIRYFSFILLQLSFDCIVSEIFFFIIVHLLSDCSCSQISYKRFEHTHGFYLWRRNWFYNFFYYYIKNVLVKNFLMTRHGFILSISVDVCVFCSSN